MSMVECHRCTKPVPDRAVICDTCTEQLRRLLADVWEPRTPDRPEPRRYAEDAPRTRNHDPRGQLRPGAFGSGRSTPWDAAFRRLQDDLETSRIRQSQRRSPYEGGSGGRTGPTVMAPVAPDLHRLATARAERLRDAGVDVAEPRPAPPAIRPESRPMQARDRRRAGSDDPGVLLEAWQASRPWDERATAALAALTGQLREWVLWVGHQRGMAVPSQVDAATSASWLGSRQQLVWLRHRDEVPDMLERLRTLVWAAQRLVDVPADRWFAGPCTAVVEVDPDAVEDRQVRQRRRRAARFVDEDLGTSVLCGADLYAVPGSPTVDCQECGTQWQVEDRREWLLTAAQDVQADAGLLSRALSSMGLPLKHATIRKWVERDLLDDHGVDEQGRRMYRLGDVQELFLSSLARTGRPSTEGRS